MLLNGKIFYISYLSASEIGLKHKILYQIVENDEISKGVHYYIEGVVVIIQHFKN